MATKITTERRSTGSISFWVNPADLKLGVNTREHTPEGIEELRASIADHGQKVPSVVRVLETGELELIAGFGRYHAVAGIPDAKLWVVVDTSAVTAKDAIITRVIENVRKNLTDLEEAKVNTQLIGDHGLTATEVAKLYGRTNTNRVAQLQKLLTLPEAVQQAVHLGKVSLAAAVAAAGDSVKTDALVAKVNAGGSITAADVASGDGEDDGEPAAKIVKRSTKHLEEVIAELEADEADAPDERIVAVLEAVVKYLKGHTKTSQGLKNAVNKLDAAIG